MRAKDYSNYGLAQELLRARTHIPELMAEAAARLSPPAQAPAIQAPEAVAWTPGPNLFKDWCSQWFGPDSDDDYLSRAVFDLPPMAQRFKVATPSAAVSAGPVAREVFNKLQSAYQGACDRIAQLLAIQAPEAVAIDMVLHCPACGLQHVDAVEELPMAMPGSMAEGSAGWVNPPHRSHLCHGCGHIWRPADVPTNGVQAVKTTGKADSPIATPSAAVSAEPWAVSSWRCKSPVGGFSFVYEDVPERVEKLRANGWTCEPQYMPVDAPAPAPTQPQADAVSAKSDTDLLNALRENSWDLRALSASDDDVHWAVIEHHMGKPHEREVGRSHRDEPREAILDALAAPTQPQQGGDQT